MASLSPFLPPLHRTVFNARLDGDPFTFPFDVAGFSGLPAIGISSDVIASNSWQVGAISQSVGTPESRLINFMGVNDFGWTVWQFTSGTVEIIRVLGYGVPARFSFVLNDATTGAFISNGTFDFGSMDTTTALVTVPSGQIMFMTRVEIPWR